MSDEPERACVRVDAIESGAEVWQEYDAISIPTTDDLADMFYRAVVGAGYKRESILESMQEFRPDGEL